MTRFLGIFREPAYSPGRHRSNDARLLEDVAHHLAGTAATVDLLPWPQALSQRPAASLVFSMCQGTAALRALGQWERDGARIVNAPHAARNTHRDHLSAVLTAGRIPFPATTLVTTTHLTTGETAWTAPKWLKRGDVHASVRADVQCIPSPEAAAAALAEFAARGISHAVWQEHRAGAEIKFYGVGRGGFFHWFFTDHATAPVADPGGVQRLAERAAAAAGLEIFGGDMILEPSGELTLIDLNDWPSFAPCRDRAAQAIADYLMRQVDAPWTPRFVSSANQSAL